eukprot:212935-Pelagomonas_calceolata.AAC.2
MQVWTASALRAVLNHLPPVQHAFAYGSGVLHQPGLYMPERGESAIKETCEQAPQPTIPSSKGPMIDFFLAVDDPLKWHTQVRSWVEQHAAWLCECRDQVSQQNIQKNPGHYSWVAKLGPGAPSLAAVQHSQITTLCALVLHVDDQIRCHKHQLVA